MAWVQSLVRGIEVPQTSRCRLSCSLPSFVLKGYTHKEVCKSYVYSFMRFPKMNTDFPGNHHPSQEIECYQNPRNPLMSFPNPPQFWLQQMSCACFRTLNGSIQNRFVWLFSFNIMFMNFICVVCGRSLFSLFYRKSLEKRRRCRFGLLPVSGGHESCSKRFCACLWWHA